MIVAYWLKINILFWGVINYFGENDVFTGLLTG